MRAGSTSSRRTCTARSRPRRSPTTRRSPPRSSCRPRASSVATMNRFTPGHAIALLKAGDEYFPALIRAIDGARTEVWLETYIFADDDSARGVADALTRAAARGVTVRVLVDGWGARHYLTRTMEQRLRNGGVKLLLYR